MMRALAIPREVTDDMKSKNRPKEEASSVVPAAAAPARRDSVLTVKGQKGPKGEPVLEPRAPWRLSAGDARGSIFVTRPGPGVECCVLTFLVRCSSFVQELQKDTNWMVENFDGKKDIVLDEACLCQGPLAHAASTSDFRDVVGFDVLRVVLRRALLCQVVVSGVVFSVVSCVFHFVVRSLLSLPFLVFRCLALSCLVLRRLALLCIVLVLPCVALHRVALCCVGLRSIESYSLALCRVE